MNREKHPSHRPPPWLRALGPLGLPAEIVIGGSHYDFTKAFKHDFFAATGLYRGASGQVVLKMGRRAPLFCFPMSWVGRFLARREIRLLRRAASVAGVPRFLGAYGDVGLVREYIEGRPLSRGDRVEDGFFPRLSAMLDEIHALEMAYVDLEKRENILLGDDGKPYLIDFQISWHLPSNRAGRSWIARRVLRVLQPADRYHLFKHWRRSRPDQLNPDEWARSFKAPFWIAGHRTLFRPLIRLRRWILVCLGARRSASGRSPG